MPVFVSDNISAFLKDCYIRKGAASVCWLNNANRPKTCHGDRSDNFNSCLDA